MLKKLFTLRVGLIAMFALLIVSYSILAIFYINSIYDASQATPTPSVKVIDRTPYDDGSTIKVPPVVTAGESFVYSTRGTKLVEAGGDVLFQVICKLPNDTSQITPLGSIYANLPKGKFDISRSYTIPLTTRTVSSDDCKLQTATHYIFYTTDKDGSQRSFEVVETGISNSFRLIVPDVKN